MLKAECIECNIKLEVSGNIVEIMSDLSTIIHEIYDSLPKVEIRDYFDHKLKELVNDGIYKWTEEDFKKDNLSKNIMTEEETKKVLEELEKLLKGMKK